MYLRSESRLNVKILSLNYCRMKEIKERCLFVPFEIASCGKEYLYKIADKLKNSSHSIDSITFLFLYLKFNLSRKLICRGDVI